MTCRKSRSLSHRVAVGIVDLKSYYIEPPDEIARRVRLCLQYAPAHKLSLAPHCGLSQTARWAAKQKLANMVAGVAIDSAAGISDHELRG